MKLTVNQLRRIIKEEVSKVTQAIDIAPSSGADDEVGQYGEAPPNWMTDWEINFYPTDDSYGYGSFTAEDFTTQEMQELKAACASAGGKLSWIPGRGPGAPATIAFRGVKFDSRSDAEAAVATIDRALSPELSDRLRASITAKKEKPGYKKSPLYKDYKASRGY